MSPAPPSLDTSFSRSSLLFASRLLPVEQLFLWPPCRKQAHLHRRHVKVGVHFPSSAASLCRPSSSSDNALQPLPGFSTGGRVEGAVVACVFALQRKDSAEEREIGTCQQRLVAERQASRRLNWVSQSRERTRQQESESGKRSSEALLETSKSDTKKGRQEDECFV